MIHVSLALPVWHANEARSEGIQVVSERTMELPPSAAEELPPPAAQGIAPAQASLHFDLTAIVIEDTGWQTTDAQQALTQALPILAQCGIAPQRIKLIRVSTPAGYRDLAPQTARHLTSLLAPARPALFFVRNTRMRPAFEAEAFGLGNTRTRPELVHTVWVTRGAPDLPETLAHELFHVIANSGEHSSDDTNLMYDHTAPGRRRLTHAQCTTLREAGLKSRLLRN